MRGGMIGRGGSGGGKGSRGGELPFGKGMSPDRVGPGDVFFKTAYRSRVEGRTGRRRAMSMRMGSGQTDKGLGLRGQRESRGKDPLERVVCPLQQ
jgi:hypothetical protein